MNARRNPQAQIANGDLLGCEEAIGYLFRRKGLLRKALTHSSVKDDRHPSNERLEFLGDAILGMVISEYLFSMLPENDEGDLTKVKSVVVSGESLSRLGLEIGIDKFLLIGKGLKLKSEIPRSLVANVIEAVIAAVYLDRGMEAARHFVLDHLHRYVDQVLNDDHVEKNYKSRLQQQAQKTLGQTPAYRVLTERGPDHSKEFRVSAVIGGREFPAGTGACKKDAEQSAARIALAKLEEMNKPSRRKARTGGRPAAKSKPEPRTPKKPRRRGGTAAPPAGAAKKPPAKPAKPAKPAAEGRKPRRSPAAAGAAKSEGGGASRSRTRGRKPPAAKAKAQEKKSPAGNGKAGKTRSRRPKAAAKPEKAPTRKPKESSPPKPRPEAKKRPARGRRRGGRAQGSGAD